VSDEAFVAHLARCRASLSPTPESPALGASHAEDLYLACAALAGDERAVAKLRREHTHIVRRYLRNIAGATSIEDLTQTLWAALLVGDGATGPKLASYSGTGRLAGFIGIAAQRLGLRSLGRQHAEKRALRRAAAQQRLLAPDAELEILKKTYRDDFDQALSIGLDALDDRARLILRMHIVDQLSVDRIAKAYGVSQSTISRWLTKAREQVIAEARRVLRARMRLADSDFEALMGLMISQVDVSLSGVLGV
jgi:RNA polymerase sigma-70 factor (ECF subfamily)